MADKLGFETTGAEAAQLHSAHIANKVILTTGVSPNSLGATFVTAIAAHKPALLILAGRSREKVQKTADVIAKESPGVKTRIIILDLASQQQVREAAKEVLAYEENIDVLVNNAGIMAQPFAKTVDGLEAQFGTNHIGHFLFTNLIFPKILASPEPRIVNITSNGHKLHDVRFDDPNWTEKGSYNIWKSYGQAKTANMLFSISLATIPLPQDKSRHLQSFSVHPGGINTNLGAHLNQDHWDDLVSQAPAAGMGDFTNLRFKNHEQGTSTHIVAAFDQEIGKKSNGAYLVDAQIAADQAKPYAKDPELAKKLWVLSEDIVGEKFEWGQDR